MKISLVNTNGKKECRAVIGGGSSDEPCGGPATRPHSHGTSLAPPAQLHLHGSYVIESQFAKPEVVESRVTCNTALLANRRTHSHGPCQASENPTPPRLLHLPPTASTASPVVI
jgi:hypothetical protein